MAQIDTKDKVTVSPPKNEKSSISKIKRDLIHFHIDNNDLSTDRGINANQIVDDTNNKTIAEAIPNEITKNEETKRKHKDWLLKAVISFLACQFGLFFILLTGVIICFIVGYMTGNPFPSDMSTSIFDMLKIYLGSIIVELISMLYFIVKNVFDTTITDLAKQFAKDKNDE